MNLCGSFTTLKVKLEQPVDITERQFYIKKEKRKKKKKADKPTDLIEGEILT